MADSALSRALRKKRELAVKPAASPSQPTSHIAVIGAGLLGRLLAWRLLRRGYRVTLFEAGDFEHPRSAAHTAAAMISPLSEVVVSEPLIYRMGMASLALWPGWLAELNASLSAPVHYAANGSLVVAHPQDAAELQQFKLDLHARLQQEDNSRWLSQQELASREPDLGHFAEALFLPEEAHLDNRRLLRCLLEEIRHLGGRCVDNTQVSFTGDQVDVDGAFDRLVDCRGIGSKPDQPGLRGVRGEVMWVETREVQLRHAVRLMHPRYKLYVVPKPDYRFIIGATEIESEDRSPISLQSTLELASALYTINPALAEARVIETDTNLRPAYPNNLPRITVTDSSISINGLYRHGYLLAPVLVDQALAVLEQPQAGEGDRGEFRERLVHVKKRATA
jgi:glycine oxidase